MAVIVLIILCPGTNITYRIRRTKTSLSLRATVIVAARLSAGQFVAFAVWVLQLLSVLLQGARYLPEITPSLLPQCCAHPWWSYSHYCLSFLQFILSVWASHLSQNRPACRQCHWRFAVSSIQPLVWIDSGKDTPAACLHGHTTLPLASAAIPL